MHLSPPFLNGISTIFFFFLLQCFSLIKFLKVTCTVVTNSFWNNQIPSTENKDNLQFDENEKRFSKMVENTVEKGEIARNEPFLFFQQCFLPFWITFCHFCQIWNSLLQTFPVWKSLKFIVWERVKLRILW